MRRREFIAGLGGAAAVWPLAANAQQPALPTVGVLHPGSPAVGSSLGVDPFREGLKDAGFVEGRNVNLDIRWVEGRYDRLPDLVADLVRRNVVAIFAIGIATVNAAKAQTASIPIIFSIGEDPIKEGFVASLNRPGGNITGFSNTEETFGGKLLSLLKTIAPRITRAAVMFNPDTAPGRGLYHLGSFEAAARALAIEPITARVHSDDDIEAAITSLGREQGGLVATPDTFINNHRGTMIAVSLRNGVPAIFDGTGFARRGGLLQYGPDFRDMYRGAASYVDRILRGAKPSDLPVQLPTKYVLVVNLQTAKTLGLTIPETLLATADEVIQ